MKPNYFPLGLEKSAAVFAHVFVAHKRPLSCKNVTHFLFHLQALHDPMKTEGQGVFCALSQHWLMHISHEQLYIFHSFSLLFFNQISNAVTWAHNILWSDQGSDSDICPGTLQQSVWQQGFLKQVFNVVILWTVNIEPQPRQARAIATV